MADRYLLESSGVDGYQLEDASGVLLLEGAAGGFQAGWASGANQIIGTGNAGA